MNIQLLDRVGLEIEKSGAYLLSRFHNQQTKNQSHYDLECEIAKLEQGQYGFTFTSGNMAITAVMMLFQQGDHIIATDDLYGGLFRSTLEVFECLGLEVTFIDTTDVIEIVKNIQPNTKAILLEPSRHPLLTVTDLAAVSKLAKENGLLTIVDNSFATPYWQNPLVLGADIVLHSAITYLSGQNDVNAGFIVVRDDKLAVNIRFIQSITDSLIKLHDAELVLHDLKTLEIRMKAYNYNARKVVDFLNGHASVFKVYYPGLESHLNHVLANKQSRGFSGLVSFDVEDANKAEKVVTALKYFTRIESCGCVEGPLVIPNSMEYSSISAERLKEIGINEGLISISIGLESIENLIEDLQQALE